MEICVIHNEEWVSVWGLTWYLTIWRQRNPLGIHVLYLLVAEQISTALFISGAASSEQLIGTSQPVLNAKQRRYSFLFYSFRSDPTKDWSRIYRSLWRKSPRKESDSYLQSQLTLYAFRLRWTICFMDYFFIRIFHTMLFWHGTLNFQQTATCICAIRLEWQCHWMSTPFKNNYHFLLYTTYPHKINVLNILVYIYLTHTCLNHNTFIFDTEEAHSTCSYINRTVATIDLKHTGSETAVLESCWASCSTIPFITDTGGKRVIKRLNALKVLRAHLYPVDYN